MLKKQYLTHPKAAKLATLMAGRSQAMQLLYYIITVSSELQVQLESSTRFIEIHSILTLLFNNA